MDAADADSHSCIHFHDSWALPEKNHEIDQMVHFLESFIEIHWIPNTSPSFVEFFYYHDPEDPSLSHPAVRIYYSHDFDIIEMIETFQLDFGRFLVSRAQSRDEYKEFLHTYRRLGVYFERE